MSRKWNAPLSYVLQRQAVRGIVLSPAPSWVVTAAQQRRRRTRAGHAGGAALGGLRWHSQRQDHGNGEARARARVRPGAAPADTQAVAAVPARARLAGRASLRTPSPRRRAAASRGVRCEATSGGAGAASQPRGAALIGAADEHQDSPRMTLKLGAVRPSQRELGDGSRLHRPGLACGGDAPCSRPSTSPGSDLNVQMRQGSSTNGITGVNTELARCTRNELVWMMADMRRLHGLGPSRNRNRHE
eukprot:scaffold966_cov415-Prasinococcus_capsulatus_cf.AAC.6